MAYHVYMLRCADATLYTGVATDLARRVAEHNGETPTGKPSKAKLGARYTAARRPVALVYELAVETRSQAQREEARLKKLTRAQKLALARAAK